MGDFQLPSLSADEALALPAGSVRFVDVRKPAAARASGLTLAGAAYVDPFQLSFAHPLIKTAGPLVFFCVHGHEVSQFAAALARVAGGDARYVRGGIEALQAAGAPMVPRASEGK